MANNTVPVQSNYDFASMAMIKREAKGSISQQASAGKKVAAEFEAEFLRLVTSSMQKASEPLKSDLFESDALDFFQDMFYEELGHYIAQRKTLGVAEYITEAIPKNIEQDG
jgi:Rod binding domain-containing protein